MIFSIRLADDEEKLARSYAISHGMFVIEVFRLVLFEKIEDEHDLTIGEAAYKKYLDDPKTHSHGRVLKMFGDDE